MTLRLGYCTNVHAGRSLAETQENLDLYATQVRRQFCPDESLPLGLWLSAESANSLIVQNGIGDFRDWLDERGFRAFTLNGFPYGDFHQKSVKHKVYQPEWGDPRRTDYTRHLIEILDGLLEQGAVGTISTLPIAWPSSDPREQVANAAAQMKRLAKELHEREALTGRRIVLCLEPEPGCVLQESRDVVDFFDQHLSGTNSEIHRRYLQVCHDTCHSSVMGEAQGEVLSVYAAHGIQVGKVQISSALSIDFDGLDQDSRRAAYRRLQEFAEDRYLHQTTCFRQSERVFHEDLTVALRRAPEEGRLVGLWRVHFHVPLFLEQIGPLGTTQSETRECLAHVLRDYPQVHHFEVETYAWNVLPSDLRSMPLAEGIQQELQWAMAALRE